MQVWSLGQKDPLKECMAIPWTEEPGRLQSIGLHRVGHDWSDLQAGTWTCRIESGVWACKGYLLSLSRSTSSPKTFSVSIQLIHLSRKKVTSLQRVKCWLYRKFHSCRSFNHYSLNTHHVPGTVLGIRIQQRSKQGILMKVLERECVGAIITNDKPEAYPSQLKVQGLNLNLSKVLGSTPPCPGNNATSIYYSLNINSSPPGDTVFGN